MSFVGRLASGKRVYVRRTQGDESNAPIAFAVFVDHDRDGRWQLVGRFHDPPQGTDAWSICAHGWEHGRSACCWTSATERMSAWDVARWHAHWWTHVADTPAEVVALRSTIRSGAEP